jgi:hypothetical protein
VGEDKVRVGGGRRHVVGPATFLVHRWGHAAQGGGRGKAHVLSPEDPKCFPNKKTKHIHIQKLCNIILDMITYSFYLAAMRGHLASNNKGRKVSVVGSYVKLLLLTVVGL